MNSWGLSRPYSTCFRHFKCPSSKRPMAGPGHPENWRWPSATRGRVGLSPCAQRQRKEWRRSTSISSAPGASRPAQISIFSCHNPAGPVDAFRSFERGARALGALLMCPELGPDRRPPFTPSPPGALLTMIFCAVVRD